MKTIERYDDPLEEIYATRRELSARYGHDVHRLAEAAREWKRRDEAEGTRFDAAFPKNVGIMSIGCLSLLPRNSVERRQGG